MAVVNSQTHRATQLHDVSLPIEGMTCASCVGRVERVLSRVPGVTDVRVNLATERADLRASAEVARDALIEAIEKAGYRVPASNAAQDSASATALETKTAKLGTKLRAAVLLSLPIVVAEMGGHLVPAIHHWVALNLGVNVSWSIQLLLTALIIVGPGRQIFVHGLQALARRTPDMNSLVAVGTLSAFGYSFVATAVPSLLPAQSLHVYYEAAAVVISLILLGRFLEAKAKGRTSQAIARLVKLSPELATVKRDGQWVEINARTVRLSDLVLIKPGARVPVDGVVEEGETRVDESMLTGEPIAVHKSLGALVRAGTVNQTGSVTVRVTAIGADTLLAQIVRMVEQAQASKLPIQALVDRVTLWFVPAVMGLALLTFGLWFVWGPEPRLSLALVNGVAVLIIACPCAMGLATPTSILVGTGRGAEIGLLFRHGEALQRLQQTKVVAFDKTGTVTLGQPRLTDWLEVGDFSRSGVLRLVAAVESHSEHPIAKAVVNQALDEKLNIPPVTDFFNEVGVGVRGTVGERQIVVAAARYFAERGNDLSAVDAALVQWQHQAKTALVVGVDDAIAGAFAISDPIKPTAVEAVTQLRALGITVAMVTGDAHKTAHAVAQQLNIHHVVAEVLPAGKVRAMKALRNQFGTTAFVGDGINDAPVLAEADVGLAMGGGTDVAIEAADVVLMRDDLTGVPAAIALARATLRNIRQNLFWAFAYNAALIPIAAGVLYPSFGVLLSPMLGGLAMAMSSVFVLFNSLRLRAFRLPHPVSVDVASVDAVSRTLGSRV